MKKLSLTKEGLDGLRKRLDELTMKRLNTIKRLRFMDKEDPISVADEIISLENSEREIYKLDALLNKVEPVVKIPHPSIISIGCTAGLDDGHRMSYYTIVDPLEVAIDKGRISEDCPLGQLLLGKHIGDIVTFTTPKGKTVSYKISSIT